MSVTPMLARGREVGLGKLCKFYYLFISELYVAIKQTLTCRVVIAVLRVQLVVSLVTTG